MRWRGVIMDDVQAYRQELGKRIAEVMAKYNTKSAASEAADVSVEQMNKWIAGAVKVPVDALYRLAAGVGADFCWLCGGESRGSVTTFPTAGTSRIQPEALRDALTAVAAASRDQGIVFDPARFPDLVFALHDYLLQARARDAAASIDMAAMGNIIRLAARS